MTITEFFANLDNLPKDLWSDIGLVAHLACKYQGRQYRDSGEHYLEHVFDVMYQMAQLGRERDVIFAGGLHDIIEDTEITKETLSQMFNPRVAFIVEAVSKKPKSCFPDKEARLYEFHQRYLDCARRDSGVIWPKLADRLHNLATLHGLHHDPLKQDRMARETLDFYIPFLNGEAKTLVALDLHPFLESYCHKLYYLAMAFLDQTT